MNDTGTFIGGAVTIAIMVFGLILSVYWLVFPLIVIAKFNKLIRRSDETNGHLAVVSHQLTIQNRQTQENIAPGVAIGPEQ